MAMTAPYQAEAPDTLGVLLVNKSCQEGPKRVKEAQDHRGNRRCDNDGDSDDDNDGVNDSIDVFPLDASESLDTDRDQIGNNSDTDDDNDGVLDLVINNVNTNTFVYRNNTNKQKNNNYVQLISILF